MIMQLHCFSTVLPMTFLFLHAILHIAGLLNDAISHNDLARFFSINPQAQKNPPLIPLELQELASSQLQPHLDITSLDRSVRKLLKGCMVPATLPAYTSASRRYKNFCQSTAISCPFPLSEETLRHYVAFLGFLQHITIKSSV